MALSKPEEAVSACQKIIDEWLADAHRPDMASAALYEVYMHFGDDPFVIPVDPKDAPAVDFDAWAYARERCELVGRSADETDLPAR